MLVRRRFTIVANDSPIEAPVTKFGGQPVWVAPPRWPLDPYAVSEQMLFLGQVRLDEQLYPDGAGIMVYLFFTELGRPLYEEGVVAVIQSPTFTTLTCNGQPYQKGWVAQATGPQVYEVDDQHNAIYRDYRVEFGSLETEPALPVTQRGQWPDPDPNLEDDEEYVFRSSEGGYCFLPAVAELAGNKLGGQPLYVCALTYPAEPFVSDAWLPLLQLAPTQGYWVPDKAVYYRNFYPFELEIGDLGILTSFISADYTRFTCSVQT